MRHLAPVLALLPACSAWWVAPAPESAHDNVPTLSVCSDVPAAHREAVEAAVDDWSRALGNWRNMALSTPPACDLWIRVANASDPAADGHPQAMGWSSIGGDTAWLRAGYYDLDPQWAASHELGHLLGAQHVRHTLMVPYWGPGSESCPDRVTVAQVAAYQHAPLAMFAWCVPQGSR